MKVIAINNLTNGRFDFVSFSSQAVMLRARETFEEIHFEEGKSSQSDGGGSFKLSLCADVKVSPKII
jgi:hypothetical protein